MSPPASTGIAKVVYSATFLVVAVHILIVHVLPALIRSWGRSLGWYLWKKTEGRRSQILGAMEEASPTDDDREGGTGDKHNDDDDGDDGWENIESLPTGDVKNGDEADKEWGGVVGFFHPFCNAGGGGERVLWAAIRATQQRWPRAKYIVYTGDHDVDKEAILNRVKARFNIRLHRPTITFLYLSTRHWVLASTWPHFTLLGQSVGSMVMLWDALSLVVPDIFVDTMGYAFALGFCKFMFPAMPVSAYVHYPTISTDMLNSLEPAPDAKPVTQGVNAGQGAGARGLVKRAYWNLFASLYAWMGGSIDVVMTNSTWTQDHIKKMWQPFRDANAAAIEVVYPPVSVIEMEREIDVDEGSETGRESNILYIAQFRPEKNHQLIIQSFAEFLKMDAPSSRNSQLVLVGSVRDDGDSKRVYQLRLLVNELHIRDRVKFHLDATWDEILDWLRKSSVGVNGMWNEHFGIGVVEYQAAGLIVVAHDSGGPKLDIVTDIDGQPTGYHATTSEEFAQAFDKALSAPRPLDMRLRARQSAKRFTEEVFTEKWTQQMKILVDMSR